MVPNDPYYSKKKTAVPVFGIQTRNASKFIIH